MDFLLKILDRLVFSATHDPVDPEERARIGIPFQHNGQPAGFELWGFPDLSRDPKGGNPWVILKFPGTAGRAERTSRQPATAFPEGQVAAVWAVNPPGYGTSGGRASLVSMGALIRTAVDQIRSRYSQARLLVAGNSLGCVWALHAAAHCPVDGVLLRNPLPLRELISQRWRYNWWNLGLAGRLAAAIPAELDAVRNAALCRAPCLVVQSEKDRLVPVRFQSLVTDALAVRPEILVIPGGDHGDPLPESMEKRFREAVRHCFSNPGGD